MKIYQGGSIDEKKFESRRWENEFPTIFEKKKIFKLAWKICQGGSIDKKKFFLLKMNLKD